MYVCVGVGVLVVDVVENLREVCVSFYMYVCVCMIICFCVCCVDGCAGKSK